MDFKKYNRIILVHKGALGDFLQTWPAILNIVNAVKGTRDIFWAGREEYFFWLKPLGIKMLEWKDKQYLDKIYTNSNIVEEIKRDIIFWFILKRTLLKSANKNIFFLKGINNSRLVWENYLRELNHIGIPVSFSWRDKWNKLFVKHKYSPYEVLIFPGSGHRLKNWPLDNFLKLGERLVSLGERVGFVLGPVEHERGFFIKGKFDIISPKNLSELQDRLLSAKLVIGNDSGPMHLAGFNNIPTIAIFGPTDPKIWGPLNAKIVKSNYACAPCTSLIDIKCKSAPCIKKIPLSQIYMEVLGILHK